MSYIVRPCSGCHENEIDQANYKWDAKNGIYLGSGCPECGYTGKRRIPITNHSSRIATRKRKENELDWDFWSS